MTNQDIKITQPVEVKSDAAARVAFDLMDHIFRHEKSDDAQTK